MWGVNAEVQNNFCSSRRKLRKPPVGTHSVPCRGGVTTQPESPRRGGGSARPPGQSNLNKCLPCKPGRLHTCSPQRVVRPNPTTQIQTPAWHIHSASDGEMHCTLRKGMISLIFFRKFLCIHRINQRNLSVAEKIFFNFDLGR